MPSTHDGQCRLEIKHVVVIVPTAAGSRNLDDGVAGDMVTGSGSK
jgi:hypothetical protein